MNQGGTNWLLTIRKRYSANANHHNSTKKTTLVPSSTSDKKTEVSRILSSIPSGQANPL